MSKDRSQNIQSNEEILFQPRAVRSEPIYHNGDARRGVIVGQLSIFSDGSSSQGFFKGYDPKTNSITSKAELKKAAIHGDYPYIRHYSQDGQLESISRTNEAHQTTILDVVSNEAASENPHAPKNTHTLPPLKKEKPEQHIGYLQDQLDKLVQEPKKAGFFRRVYDGMAGLFKSHTAEESASFSKTEDSCSSENQRQGMPADVKQQSNAAVKLSAAQRHAFFMQGKPHENIHDRDREGALPDAVPFAAVQPTPELERAHHNQVKAEKIRNSKEHDRTK